MMCKLNINSTFEEIRRASDALHEFCDTHNVADNTRGHLELILVEALNNVVEHAYLTKPGGEIQVELNKIDEKTVIKITDSGIAAPGTAIIESSELPDENKLPEGGWGLCLIQALADTIEYFRYSDHNTLVLTKSIALTSNK